MKLNSDSFCAEGEPAIGPLLRAVVLSRTGGMEAPGAAG
jgi:hypothetical protein